MGLPDFKKKAIVIMGEPNADYKEAVQKLTLAGKQQKADVEKKKKVQEEERKRLLDEKKRRAEEARKAKQAKQAKKEGVDAEEEEQKEETKEEETKDADTTADTPVELTEEEKQLWYRKLNTPDMSERAVANSYA